MIVGGRGKDNGEEGSPSKPTSDGARSLFVLK